MYRLYKLLESLPLTVLYGLASVGAWLLESVFRYRVAVVNENLARAFPEKSAAERAAIRHAFYRGLADTTVEIIAGNRFSLEQFRQHLTINNVDLLRQLSDNGGRSIIVMTLHQGNWEWMLHRSTAEYAIDQAFIYKTLHNAGADRYSLEARTRFGSDPIEMRRASRDMVRNRRRPRIIYTIADQSPGNRERVYWTEFLHQPTAFFAGSAALARATGYPVAFAGCERTGRGQYAIDLHLITDDPKSLTEEEITERYVRLAEASIRKSPADWLWTNRRWKRQPPESSPRDQAATPDSSS